MNNLAMLMTLKPYRYAKKMLVYDYDNGGRYILNRKKLLDQFSDRYVRQIIYYNGGYAWISLERIPRL